MSKKTKNTKPFIWSADEENWHTATNGLLHIAAAIESDGFWHAYYRDNHVPENTMTFNTLEEAKAYAEDMAGS